MGKNEKELYAFKFCSAAAYQRYVARTNSEEANPEEPNETEEAA